MTDAADVTDAADGALACVAPLVQCGAACVDLTSDPRNCRACGLVCEPGVPCINGFCDRACPPGQLRCGAACVNPLGDRSHCGGCNRQCPGSLVCTAGVCTMP